MQFVKEFDFKTLQEAWEGLNNYMCQEEEFIVENHGTIMGPQLVAYNIFAHVGKAWVDPEFDFGKTLGYTPKKWSSLVKNYVNTSYLDLIRAEIGRKGNVKSRSYNHSYHFTNLHGSGKDCLVALVFKKPSDKPIPTILFIVRTSEITKRLIFDLLLVQRIGEYVYGPNGDFDIDLFLPSMYIAAESLSMYDNHKSIEKLLKGKQLGKYQTKILRVLREFKAVEDLSTVKYKVNKRSVRQLQRGEDGELLSTVASMKAKQLKLNEVIGSYPKEVISPSQRRAHDRAKKKKL